MNILFVTPYPPSRIRVRPFELLRSLAKRGHKITLATLTTPTDEREGLETLREMGIHIVEFQLPPMRPWLNLLATLPTATPLQANYCWHPRFAKMVVALAQAAKAEIVHIEHLRGARYGLYLKEQLAATNQAIPIIWDSVDCITHLFRQAATQSHSLQSRLLTKVELGRTSRYEGRLVEQFDNTLVTSVTDKAALEQLVIAAPTQQPHQRERIQVLANGVDLDYFIPPHEARQAATLIFTGKMSYHANSTAAQYLVREIMPLVWEKRPDVDLWIVGKDPTPAVSELTELNAQKGSKISGKVVVTGTVPDLRPYLCQATIAVAPLRYGAGIQNKVLEAMACAIPVIASPQAVAALHTKVGYDLLVGHNAQEFAQAIVTLLASPTQQMRVGQAGRTYVQEHHAWDAMTAQLETIYADALQAAPQNRLRGASNASLRKTPEATYERSLATPNQ